MSRIMDGIRGMKNLFRRSRKEEAANKPKPQAPVQERPATIFRKPPRSVRMRHQANWRKLMSARISTQGQPTGKRPRKSRGLPILNASRFRDRRPLKPTPWVRPTKAERKALQGA